MFEIGDYVVNATNGICQITEVIQMDMTGGKNPKPYFILIPVEEQTAKVFIPVDNAVNRIRMAIDAEEALRVIDSIPSIGEIWIDNEKVRELRYKEAVKSCDPTQLVGIIKTLYRRREERVAAGKKSTAVDDRYFKMAESHLYSELAFALGKQKSDMEQVIADRIDSLTEA